MSEEKVAPVLEPEGIVLIEEYGIPYPEHGLAESAEEAVSIADRVGYPVVLKVVSPDVIHKSDAGGVALGLDSAAAVRDAYDRIIAAVARSVPAADVRGMLVCREAGAGTEVIVGGTQDEMFGPTLMFGLGGVFAEVLRDVSFRVVPVSRFDAEQLVREVRGFPLLAGARGEPPRDVAALVDLLLAVSRMMTEHPGVIELDLNPVRVYTRGLLALDVRLIGTLEPEEGYVPLRSRI